MPVASEARSGEVEPGRRAEFFDELGKRDRSRATRLETFSDLGAQGEEQNPPLNGISIEDAGADSPRTEIMSGGEIPGDERYLPPTIARVAHGAPKTSADGCDEAPEIEDVG
jgi:hypothetical protein